MFNYDELLNKPNITIEVTNKCNFDCKYCYVNPTCNSGEVVSFEVLDKVVEIVRARAGLEKDTNIDIFGGEPFVVWDRVKYFIDRVSELESKRFSVQIFTNGSLLTEEILKYIREKGFIGLQISIDGCKESHDAGRVYPDGSGTYDDVMIGVDLYNKVFGKNAADNSMMVVSPFNLVEVTDSIIAMYADGKRIRYSTLTRDDIWTEETIQQYEYERYRLADFLISTFINNDPMNDVVFIRPILDMVFGYDSFCGICNNMTAVSPSGDLYPCQRFYNANPEKFIIGNIVDGIDLSSKDYLIIKNIKKSNIRDCRQCKYDMYPGCPGQCLASCYETHGTYTKMIDSVCRVQRIAYETALYMAYALKDMPIFRTYLNEAVGDRGDKIIAGRLYQVMEFIESHKGDLKREYKNK